jgi:hypothetical protein
MLRPALAYPATVAATSIPAVTVAEKTISNRSLAATGILSPVVNPLEIVPNAIMPVNAGAKVTIAPGTAVKLLSGVVDRNNCAVIVIVDPTKLSAAVVLK